MMSLPRSVKNVLGFVATRVFPSTIALRASGQARRRLRVKVRSERIEVVEESTGRQIWLARENAVYVPDMMNSFDYYFDSAESFGIGRGSGRFSVVDFSTPRFQKVRGFDDFPVLCPSLTEPFSTTRQYLDFARLEPGDNVIDLGCYSGLTAIAFSKTVGPSGRVVALEPDPLNFAAARTNVEQHARANALKNIVLRQEAAHSECGKLRFSSEGAMGSAAASVVGDFRGRMVEVDATTLDAVVAREGLEQVAFVKIDIEGAEVPVLTSARDFLLRFRPRLMIEPHMVGGRLTERAAIEFLSSLGYSCQVIVQHGVELPLVAAAFPS